MVTRIGAYGAILVLLLGIAPPTLRAHLATDVRPVLDCVEKVGDDGFVAFFGYESRSSETVTIRVGDDNHFAPGPADQAQPEDFLPGRHRSVISVPLSGVGELGWTLNDVTATASAASKRCRRSSDLIVLPAAHNGAVMGRDGYAIRFDHVDFGHEPGFFKSFSALMATPNPGNHVELWVDAPNKSMGGRMIADLRTHARDAGPGVGSGFEVFRFQSTPLVFSPIGIHNVFIVFNGHENREARVNGGGSGIGKFKEFDISPLSISPPKPGSLLAVDYDLQSGISNFGSGVTDVDAGDFVAYRGVDFGELETLAFFSALVATPNDDNFILVHRDALDGPLIAALPLVPTGDDFEQFTTLHTPLFETLAGKHDVYLEFASSGSSTGSNIGKFSRFQFEPSPTTIPLEGGTTEQVSRMLDESGLFAEEADFFGEDGTLVLATAVRVEPSPEGGGQCPDPRGLPPSPQRVAGSIFYDLGEELPFDQTLNAICRGVQVSDTLDISDIISNIVGDQLALFFRDLQGNRGDCTENCIADQCEQASSGRDPACCEAQCRYNCTGRSDAPLGCRIVVTGPPVGNPHTPPRPRVFVGNVVVKNAPRTPTRPPTMQPPPGQSCFAFIDRIAREGSQTYECFGGSSTFAATKEAAAASVLTGFKPITGVGGALTRLCLVNVNDLLGKVREPTTGLPYTCPGLQTLDTGICNRFAVGTLMGANFFGDCGPGSLPGACSLPFAQCPVQGGTVCCKAGEMCTPDGCKAP